ncbi:MAG TPA: TraR/DksA C4-type zinc finger protein [Candidatus Cloacimonadota bacterium]|nr:TraR/DksA C4-type zinc finger protein [Candidatus Cloacimonadota bacterium]HPT71018.1 TraR/DksA C4-type zinc finger protein [Candidatus Cloacimonadota bacterium]
MADKLLTEKQLKFFEEMLLKERDESLKMIKSINDMQSRGAKESTGDLSGYAFHQADQGSDTNSLENQVFMLEQEQEKVKLLNQSLKRIYDGTYGVCEICGNPIPEERLKVISYARYCISCMEKEERKKNKNSR